MKADVFRAGLQSYLLFCLCRFVVDKASRGGGENCKEEKVEGLFLLGLIIFLNASVGFSRAAIYNVLYFIFMKHLCNKDKVFN